MNIQDPLLQVLQAVLVVATGIIVPFLARVAKQVIGYIEQKLTASEFEQFKSYAGVAVKAAQDALGSQDGVTRRADAEARLSALTGGKLSPTEIDALLRSAYSDIKTQIAGATEIKPMITVTQPLGDSSGITDTSGPKTNAPAGDVPAQG